jgi:hypothetical protein
MRITRPAGSGVVGFLVGASGVLGHVLGRRDQIVLKHSQAADVHKTPVTTLDEFLNQESIFAWENLLCNIGPGQCVPGALPGVVVASPDTVDPPCRLP